MIVKDLKEILLNVPDDTPLGYILGENFPTYIFELINIDTNSYYNKEKNQFIMATFNRNYITNQELDEIHDAGLA